MTIGTFIRQLLDGEPQGPTAVAADVSVGGLHNLITGKVKEPQPQTLAKLARYFGATDAERRLLYAQMMELSGYFALLPKAMLDAFHQVVSAPLANEADDENSSLFEEVAAILERADVQERNRLALDVLRAYYPQEAQALLQALQARTTSGSAPQAADQ